MTILRAAAESVVTVLRLPAACSIEIIRNCDGTSTLQAKSIDFYGTREIDEKMCTQNVDTDELRRQVDFHNTWQDHDSRFTTFNPLQQREIGEARGEKKSNGQNEEINQSETVLIMEAGSTSLAESSSH